MAHAFQSTLTPTRAAASRVIPACSATSRTRTRLIPAASLSVNTESAGCQAWARPTVSVTAGTQERRVKEVREAGAPLINSLNACLKAEPLILCFVVFEVLTASHFAVCVSNIGPVYASNPLLSRLSIS